MNASFLRVMIVIALGAANFFGLMTPGYAGAVAVKEPPCGMACCLNGGCDCQAVPAETPPQPAQNSPVAIKQAVKFVPMLLAILPASNAGCTTVLAPQSALMGRGAVTATPIFRLHCAMLM